MDAYLEGVHAVKDSITIGDTRDPATVLGPLISDIQRDKVQGYVESGLEQGAELITGGKRPDHMDKGFFFEPTVFVGTNDMRIAQEEIFGPVLTVIPYSGKDEDAIRLANDTIYGLGGGVMAANTARAFNVARQVRAGSMTAAGVGQVPGGDPGRGEGQGPGWGQPVTGIAQSGAFGGFKQSGIGREWGRLGLEDFTEVKSITWT